MTMHGLFVQRPFASSLVYGTKMIETRTYPLPESLFGKRVFVIETPRSGHRRAGDRGMIVGTVRFGGWKLYLDKDEWLGDALLHRVDADDPQYGWRDDKKKYGWEVTEYEPWTVCHYKGTGYGRVWVTDCEPVASPPDVRRAARS
jgi:hypothetical protein